MFFFSRFWLWLCAKLICLFLTDVLTNRNALILGILHSYHRITSKTHFCTVTDLPDFPLMFALLHKHSPLWAMPRMGFKIPGKIIFPGMIYYYFFLWNLSDLLVFVFEFPPMVNVTLSALHQSSNLVKVILATSVITLVVLRRIEKIWSFYFG